MEESLKIISIDEIKKCLPGYSPDRADDFHIESAKIANKLFDQELKKIKDKKVVLMCGGSASGKSEFIEKFFIADDFEGIIFDSTLSNVEGAEIKIKNIIKSGNTPIICLILPDNLRRCFAAFNKRDRKIPEFRFYETHCGARKVALWIAQNYEEVEILIYQNSHQPNNLEEDQISFKLERFDSKKEMMDFLLQNQYSENEINDFIINNLNIL
jgi:hypothetical protein